MNGVRRRIAAVCLIAPLSCLACTVFSPRPDPSRFFMLTPLSEPAANAGPLRGRVLGVGPITFPHHLDRPEMVTRVGPNEVRNAASDYWAGSLAKQFESTLIADLQSLVGADLVETYPWFAGMQPDILVEVDVRQLELASDGRAHLVARWRVRNGSSRDALRSAETALAKPVPNQDPGATAAALSDLVGDFSRELAEAIGAGFQASIRQKPPLPRTSSKPGG